MDSTGSRVKAFYNQNPFPGFDINKYMLKEDLYRYANVYARMLDNQIPWKTSILDAGCGTGQLACLLSLKDRRITGLDFSEKSIHKANELKNTLKLHNVSFHRDDLMKLKLEQKPFDYIFCNGVLHHTNHPYQGFLNLLPYSKRGTYFIIGLYNRYGRLWHQWRRRYGTMSNRRNHHERIQEMICKNEGDREKLETWFQDQYLHPYESTHTIQEILRWYKKHNIEYISSLPPIELFRKERAATKVFRTPQIQHWRRAATSIRLKQITWIITLRKTGGYFTIVGRKT